MRGAVDGLNSPFPLGEQLPSVYADDDFAQRFVGGLDDLFSPLLSVLDNLAAYLRPELAPSDFVAWLGTWVGAELSGDESDESLRAAVAGAAAMHRHRGTLHGLAEAVRLGFGIEPEITESGGMSWSARPLGPLPGDAQPRLEVRLTAKQARAVDLDRLRALVASVRPAHVPYSVIVEKS
ncbi:phage tail protein [Catenulispora sp. NF23]|uniref:Phage tail protein n=1 Tax=Catenulispora pinistramenti TaxID=2705254 RepID=A0ABS5L3Z8_9ACTN|nr:phage tail protein [Catenulispora pinistramenti]MBS2537014.1 phage tail protein [Catenulispora pinistramenti]MBS2553083.1 phage tail protein [Catenulispora pinistramenti]